MKPYKPSTAPTKTNKTPSSAKTKLQTHRFNKPSLYFCRHLFHFYKISGSQASFGFGYMMIPIALEISEYGKLIADGVEELMWTSF
jgi:hypothetical protein